MNKLFLLLVLLILNSNNPALAVNFGQQAATLTIQEEGFTAMMTRKLQALDLSKEEEKMKQIARDRVENPAVVEKVKPATADRSFYYEPTYTLDQDAVLPCGKVLHRAGTTVNPLDYLDLERKLFFIDGRQEEQLEWLQDNLTGELEKANKVENRIILVGGNVLKLRERFGPEVYFDQMGELTTKFGITASPAVVVQEGRRLKVQEYCLDE